VLFLGLKFFKNLKFSWRAAAWWSGLAHVLFVLKDHGSNLGARAKKEQITFFVLKPRQSPLAHQSVCDHSSGLGLSCLILYLQ
jgi:hypothetical protein